MTRYLTRLKSGETGRRFGWALQVALILPSVVLLGNIFDIYGFQKANAELTSSQHDFEIGVIFGCLALNLAAVAVAGRGLAKDSQLRVPWNFLLVTLAGVVGILYLPTSVMYLGAVLLGT